MQSGLGIKDNYDLLNYFVSHRDTTQFQISCRNEIESFLSDQDQSAEEETYMQKKYLRNNKHGINGRFTSAENISAICQKS